MSQCDITYINYELFLQVDLDYLALDILHIQFEILSNQPGKHDQRNVLHVKRKIKAVFVTRFFHFLFSLLLFEKDSIFSLSRGMNKTLFSLSLSRDNRDGNLREKQLSRRQLESQRERKRQIEKESKGQRERVSKVT